MLVKIQHIHDRILYKMWHIILPHVNNKSYPSTFYQNQKKLLRTFYYYLHYDEKDFIGILHYVERLASTDYQRFITTDNKHYLIFVLIILYSKMYHDHYYDNAYYAKLTHMKTVVLNQIEWTMFLHYHQSSSLIISESDFNNMNQEIDLEIKNEHVYHFPDTDDADDEQEEQEERYIRWKP